MDIWIVSKIFAVMNKTSFNIPVQFYRNKV